MWVPPSTALQQIEQKRDLQDHQWQGTGLHQGCHARHCWRHFVKGNATCRRQELTAAFIFMPFTLVSSLKRRPQLQGARPPLWLRTSSLSPRCRQAARAAGCQGMTSVSKPMSHLGQQSQRARQLQGARLHHCGRDCIEVDKLKRQLPLAPCHVQHAAPTGQRILPKNVNQESAGRQTCSGVISELPFGLGQRIASNQHQSGICNSTLPQPKIHRLCSGLKDRTCRRRSKSWLCSTSSLHVPARQKRCNT